MNQTLLEFGIYALVIIDSYLIGSISPSILIARAKGKNILKEGSCNAGATNAIRVLGLKLGLCVFFLDVLKGFIMPFVCSLFFWSSVTYIAGICVVLGHVFSVFYKFKAGKGVAPSIGVALAINWKLAIIVVVFGIVLVLITKRVSIGSLSAAVAFPVATWFLQNDFFWFSIAFCLLIIFTHRSNIKRLIKRQEKPLEILVRKSKKI